MKLLERGVEKESKREIKKVGIRVKMIQIKGEGNITNKWKRSKEIKNLEKKV